MKTKLLAALVLPGVLHAAPTTPPPFVYENPERVESTSDGGLRLAVGVHNIQVVRSNRTNPVHSDGVKDTYLHQPMLAWWNGRFYLEYLSGPVGEHETSGSTSLMNSFDGIHWTVPRTIFPSFPLPDGTQTVNHQRMGFYTAPNGRLLVLAFYGKLPSPNDGTGIGRTVREINADGNLGPVYFIKRAVGSAFPKLSTPFPDYTASPDKEFVAACDALLANKLMTAQWWEEDQLDESGFYTIKGKALSYVHRPDGTVLGVWKNALVATTNDAGGTWTEKQFGTNLPNNASKYALTRTGDNRYALFLNPTNRLRYPLAVMTSDDCEHFHDLLTIHGETPDQRFAGAFKNLGPQYVRVIDEGNGTPPDAKQVTWVTYSVNKEDIWVARVPVPITSTVAGPVSDNFNGTTPGTLPAGWNIYSPLWAPVRIVSDPTVPPEAPANWGVLELRDEDPYDYARATRIFPETHGLKAGFKVLARQTNARLEIELADRRGNRPFLFALGEDGHLWACHEGVWTDNGAYTAGQWISFQYEASPKATSDRGDLIINGKPSVPRSIGPVEAAATVERLSFRTGPQRRQPTGGRDLPNADQKAPAAVFLVDDVVITPVK